MKKPMLFLFKKKKKLQIENGLILSDNSMDIQAKSILMNPEYF